MATNLVLCYPHIPKDASVTTPLVAGATGFSANNLVTGARERRFRSTSTTAAEWYVTYDLGSGNTLDPDYYLCARADINYGRNPVNMFGRGSNDSGFSSQDETQSALSSLQGPNSEDKLQQLSWGTAYRYFRFGFLVPSAAYTVEFSKVYFGSFFDFGRDPVHPRRLDRKILRRTGRDPVYGFQFTWEGISDSTLNSFFDLIVKDKDVSPIFLYTKTAHDILNDHRLIHAWVKDVRIKNRISDNNEVSVTFEEIL